MPTFRPTPTPLPAASTTDPVGDMSVADLLRGNAPLPETRVRFHDAPPHLGRALRNGVCHCTLPLVLTREDAYNRWRCEHGTAQVLISDEQVATANATRAGLVTHYTLMQRWMDTLHHWLVVAAGGADPRLDDVAMRNYGAMLRDDMDAAHAELERLRALRRDTHSAHSRVNNLLADHVSDGEDDERTATLRREEAALWDDFVQVRQDLDTQYVTMRQLDEDLRNFTMFEVAEQQRMEPPVPQTNGARLQGATVEGVWVDEEPLPRVNPYQRVFNRRIEPTGR